MYKKAPELAVIAEIFLQQVQAQLLEPFELFSLLRLLVPLVEGILVQSVGAVGLIEGLAATGLIVLGGAVGLSGGLVAEGLIVHGGAEGVSEDLAAEVQGRTEEGAERERQRGVVAPEVGLVCL
eukprot:CAMPEP_0179066034 /NCGR_PEP_ID=MMETSP0796-20121207/28773_1 /TAXON_ID=73915 /ORGANISM="Pyrodinium bahamense, Strain pbaha01" /LENGTH=123 /DNA_ID=CAMNT_0020763035 /DNA_START=128 /DNA_END=497 /DNA_ORIENTATION=-